MRGHYCLARFVALIAAKHRFELPNPQSLLRRGSPKSGLTLFRRVDDPTMRHRYITHSLADRARDTGLAHVARRILVGVRLVRMQHAPRDNPRETLLKRVGNVAKTSAMPQNRFSK